MAPRDALAASDIERRSDEDTSTLADRDASCVITGVDDARVLAKPVGDAGGESVRFGDTLEASARDEEGDAVWSSDCDGRGEERDDDARALSRTAALAVGATVLRLFVPGSAETHATAKSAARASKEEAMKRGESGKKRGERRARAMRGTQVQTKGKGRETGRGRGRGEGLERYVRVHFFRCAFHFSSR